jgi:hypothetical protein
MLSVEVLQIMANEIGLIFNLRATSDRSIGPTFHKELLNHIRDTDRRLDHMETFWFVQIHGKFTYVEHNDTNSERLEFV